MKTTVVDGDGNVACPHCGARNSFTVKRTGKAKLMGGLTVGLGALAAPKRLKCNGCGKNLKRGGSNA
jgi:phage FluMu protein Com